MLFFLLNIFFINKDLITWNNQSQFLENCRGDRKYMHYAWSNQWLWSVKNKPTQKSCYITPIRLYVYLFRNPIISRVFDIFTAVIFQIALPFRVDQSLNWFGSARYTFKAPNPMFRLQINVCIKAVNSLNLTVINYFSKKVYFVNPYL